MTLIDRSTIITFLSPPTDHLLATQLVDEFISAEKRFIQRDWEPAELDGGQFCEIASRIYYHIDSSVCNRTKNLDDCLKYIENEAVKHEILPRHDALHICKVIRTVYKFRSQRGAVHISPNYTPNHMDSRLIVENIRWIMNETLRIFWNGDRERVASAVRELLQFDVPCVGKFEDEVIVQRTDLTSEEEILVLLHYAGEAGFDRGQIGRYARLPASTVTRTIQKLCSPSVRQVIFLRGGNYRLTDLGSKRIRDQLSSKLVI